MTSHLFLNDFFAGNTLQLNGEVGAVVPGVDLAHAGKVEPGITKGNKDNTY